MKARWLFLFFITSCTSSNPATDAGSDASTNDAATDAPIADAPSDTANADGSNDAGLVFGAFDDKSQWETFVIANASTYRGGTFDGRYVYFAPYGSGRIVRVDSKGSFPQSNAWESYDLTAIDAGLEGFAGAIFDGGHVYLCPNAGKPGLFVRYDAAKPLAMASSWETSDLSSIPAYGYSSGAFDGKYVYYAHDSSPQSDLVRFDTTKSFGSLASFDHLFVSGISQIAGAWDGKFVYFAPQHGPNDQGGASAPAGVVFRYDTTKAFFDNNSYQPFFDMGMFVDMAARRFGGVVFDGRYLYYVPSDGLGMVDSGQGSLVVRYDTQGPLDQAGSYDKLDLMAINGHGFKGGTFDGRYVYFAPQATSIAVRYDTTKPFNAMSSWQPYDLTAIDGAAKGFYGAVFDGMNVYFVPNANGVAVRFHARSQPYTPMVPSSFL